MSAMFLTWYTVCDWLVGGDELPLVHFTVSGRVVSWVEVKCLVTAYTWEKDARVDFSVAWNQYNSVGDYGKEIHPNIFDCIFLLKVVTFLVTHKQKEFPFLLIEIVTSDNFSELEF